MIEFDSYYMFFSYSYIYNNFFETWLTDISTDWKLSIPLLSAINFFINVDVLNNKSEI